ncbi:MAG: GFA family protein [Pseudomonadota bacterium]
MSLTPAYATGGCQCGAVRYRAALPLGRSSICHCRMCQRAVGNAFAPLVVAKDVAWNGTPATWASSNIAERGFCAECGTPLFLRDFDAPARECEIMIATLDDPEIAPPQHHVGIESRIDWLKIADGLPEYVTGASSAEPAPKINSYQDPAALAVKEEQ